MSNLATLMEEFHTIAHSPRKQLQRYLSEGKKVIGWMPIYAPTEIVYALDMIPFGIWGADRAVAEAKQYYPAFYCGIVQTALELGITGEYEGLSAVMIPALCDTLKCQTQNWKYAVPQIPMIPVIHPQNRKQEYSTTFLYEKYKKITQELSDIAGIEYCDSALQKAIKATNQHNAAMNKFSQIAIDYPNTIDAITRKNVYKSAYFLHIEEHTRMVNELIALLSDMPKEQANKKKVIVSGIIADNDDLLSIFQDMDLQIVGDDLAHESRQYRTDIPNNDDPLQALAVQFCDRDNCSVLYDKDKGRVDFLAQMVHDRSADGLIMVMTKFCDPEEFDYVPIKQKLEREEIPMLQIEIDRQMDNFEQVRTAVQTFAELLND